MRPPRHSWCIHIDITYRCTRGCSGCHRMVPHFAHPAEHDMTVEQVEQAVEALRDYTTNSPGDPKHWRRGVKCVSLFGGEPLLHPELGRMLDAISALPQQHRALYTGLRWERHPLAHEIRETFLPQGWLQQNLHTHPCMHQPSLVAVGEVVLDKDLRDQLIRNCPVQRYWSAAINHKGFFHCEVAAAFDALFHGPGGLPVEPGCWDRDLDAYQDQIDRWCPRCGMCLPLPGRDSRELVDDVSPANLTELRLLQSPRAIHGHCNVIDAQSYDFEKGKRGWDPLRYNRVIEKEPWEEVDYMIEGARK